MKCQVEECNNEAKLKYCSDRCCNKNSARNRRSKKLYKKICKWCHGEFNAPAKKYIYCSLECRNNSYSKQFTKFLDIPSCLESADRKIDKNLGYVRVYVPMHPEANTWGYVYEHRVVAEQMIGRRLKPNEIVHHKNEKRWDNDPSNLEVMDAVEHSKMHGKTQKKNKV